MTLTLTVSSWMKVTLTIIARNAYVKELADKSLLNILQPKCVKNAFNEKDERENRLFQLFLLNRLWEAILVWTNEKLVSTEGKNTITIKKLMAYVGLELAMSLIQIRSISTNQLTLERMASWYAWQVNAPTNEPHFPCLLYV
jgi:hypothetical protein